jgi:RES domain-containing protein
MSGRFDLPVPLGTCYLAGDPVGALLEVLGVDRRDGVVAAEFFAERQLRKLRVHRDYTLADLTSRRAAGFGITSEIGTIVPYEMPQAWAARLRSAGFEGVVHWLRHDPSRAVGWALFGRAGERRHWRRGSAIPISGDLVKRLWTDCRIAVLPVPAAADLTILDDA